MKTHELKIWPKFLSEILCGRKKAEVRRDDRGFEVGDLLALRAWEPEKRQYTGEIRTFRVTHITNVPYSDYVVLSIGEP